MFVVPFKCPLDASNWFHNVSTYGEEVIEYGTILSSKSHLNENY
jgi:hypothetical protein